MTVFSVLLVPEIICSSSNYLTSIRLDFPWPHRNIISVKEEKEEGEKEKDGIRRQRRGIFRDNKER